MASINQRLQNLEREAKALFERQLDEITNRLTGDQRLVIAAGLAADLLAGDEWNATPAERERMKADLDRDETEISEREAAEPGFRDRVLAELEAIEYPPILGDHGR